jgi:hypothetical protein
MKTSLAILIGTLCATATLPAAAAAQSANTTGNEISPPPMQQHQGVRTAEWGFETPNMIPLDPQPVQSQGAATRPGPRNRHLTPPHGGLVTAGDRSNIPGRE